MGQIAAKAAKQREELKQRQAARKQKEETAAKKLEAARKQKEEAKKSETTEQALNRLTREIQNEAHGKILKKQMDSERQTLARETENKRSQAFAKFKQDERERAQAQAKARRDEQKRLQAQREAEAATVNVAVATDSSEEPEKAKQKCTNPDCYCHRRGGKWTFEHLKQAKTLGVGGWTKVQNPK